MGYPARLVLALAALVAAAPVTSGAQGWKPDKSVELIVSCAPGCGPDNAARLMQKIFQAHRLIDAPITIQNKSGGGGIVAQTYLRQFKGNGHYVLSADRGLLVSHALGRYDNTQLTPIAILFGEWIGVAVKADSPIKSGRDLIERLKKDPNAHSLGIATSLGNTNHQGVAMALKTAGIDIRKVRTVTFNSGALAITAMLGGHIDVVPVSVGLWPDHVKTGAARVIAITSPTRMTGALADVPTWREQGADAVLSNWRAFVGPSGMGAAQVAYWENTFERLVETEDWKAELVRRHATPQFMRAAAMKKYMDDEYPAVQALLAALELTKKP